MLFDSDVIFVAIVLLIIFLGPVGITVFLALNVRILFKAFGNIARFDLVVLFTAVALDRSADKTRINNLAFLSFEAFLLQLEVEVIEQCFNETLLGQLLSE